MMTEQWKLEISEKGGVASIWGPRKDGNTRLSDGRGLIAQVDIATLETKSRVSYPEIDQESLSYARLMAASPDLLAALKCFVDDDRFQVAVGGNPNVVPKMIDAARAAIARAEGQDTQLETTTEAK